MIRPLGALERLTFLEPEGKVGYRWGRDGTEQETTEYAVVDRIIDHLKLTFVAAKPPPSHVFEQVAFRVYKGPCPCLPTIRFLSGKIIDLSVRLYMARFGVLTVPAEAC
jgi:hypothetical protein